MTLYSPASKNQNGQKNLSDKRNGDYQKVVSVFLLKTNYTKNSFEHTVIITKNTTLSTVKSTRYFFVLSGYRVLNSENVIKLASDEINVPVPPMFTPISNG